MADNEADSSTRHVYTSELQVELTPEMVAKLGEAPMRAYLRDKYENEAQRRWDIFYHNNTTNFFKDRHWILREFPELASAPSADGKPTVFFLEAGCGVGNTVFPLLEDSPGMFAYACDFSPNAVELVKKHADYAQGRCTAFQADLTKDALTLNIPPHSVDFVSLFFCLSAISPAMFPKVLENISSVLKPGGRLLFRDYGLYDLAMFRFKEGQKLEDRFYVRGDGTRAYYFTTEEITELCAAAGLVSDSCVYVKTDLVNRKMNLCAPRIFVQAQFQKLVSAEVSTEVSTEGAAAAAAATTTAPETSDPEAKRQKKEA